MVSQLLVVLGIGAAAYLGGSILLGADKKVENRRKAAAQIAGWLKEEGLTYVPEILIDYSAGDYSGVAARLREGVEGINTDEKRRAVWDGLFTRQLGIRLKDDKRRSEILEAVDSFRLLVEAKEAKKA